MYLVVSTKKITRSKIIYFHYCYYLLVDEKSIRKITNFKKRKKVTQTKIITFFQLKIVVSRNKRGMCRNWNWGLKLELEIRT